MSTVKKKVWKIPWVSQESEVGKHRDPPWPSGNLVPVQPLPGAAPHCKKTLAPSCFLVHLLLCSSGNLGSLV